MEKRREETTKILKKHWSKIDSLERKAYEENREDLFIQVKLMKKQCKEILEKFYEKE